MAAGTLAVEAPRTGATPSEVRFEAVQGLRAVAALAVFFIHVSETRYGTGFGYHAVGFDRYVRAFFDELAVGVPIFFAISGFVMYRPFVVRHLGRRHEPSISSYAARRFLRIYPAYWAALVVTVLVVSDQITLRGTSHWFSNLGLVQWYVPGATGHGLVFEGMLQAWTLTAEVTFYAALPIFAFLVRRASGSDSERAARAHRAAISLVIVAGVLARVWDIYGAPPDWVTILPIYLAFFGTGMALALHSTTTARSAGDRPGFIARHPGLCVAVALLAFIAATVTADITDGAVLELTPTPAWELVTRFVLQWIVVAGLIVPAVLGVERGGRVRSALSCRPLVFLGAVSYGIYLWHWAIIRWLAGHWFDATSGQTMAKVTLVGLPATVAIAYTSYRLVEKPAMSLAKRVR